MGISMILRFFTFDRRNYLRGVMMMGVDWGTGVITSTGSLGRAHAIDAIPSVINTVVNGSDPALV